MRKKEAMVRTYIFAAIIIFMVGCSKTENGLVFGIPDYEKRDIAVSEVDLNILIKANELLSTEDFWGKDIASKCNDVTKLSLYCALEQASISVMGKYVHRQPALQEVRFAIDDLYRDRWEKHRLIDFNGNENTTFKDVKNVIKKATETVESKIRITNSSS